MAFTAESPPAVLPRDEGGKQATLPQELIASNKMDFAVVVMADNTINNY